jgi:hypothetical protein
MLLRWYPGDKRDMPSFPEYQAISFQGQRRLFNEHSKQRGGVLIMRFCSFHVLLACRPSAGYHWIAGRA